MRSKYEMKISKNYTMPIDGFKEYGTNSNLLVIGSSGTGKTMNVVLPMLLDNFDKEPVTFVVQDCKGALYKNLSKKFMSEGYDVKILDFTRPSKSNKFNPLEYVETIDDARKIISPIVLSQVKNQKDAFWEIAATDMLCGLVMLIKENYHKAFLNLCALNIFLNWLSQDYSRIVRAKKESKPVDINIDRLGKPHLAKKDEGEDKIRTAIYCKIKKLANKKNAPQYYKNLDTCITYSEGTFTSIIAVAKAALSIYIGKDIKNVVGSYDEMRLGNVANSKTIIFINPSDTSRIYDPIVSMFYNICLQKVVAVADKTKQGRLKYPFRMIIDDFASGARIDDFDKMISNIRSRNMSCTLLIQSISQLESIYSKPEASTIISNCSTQLYLGSNDFNQELDVSKRLNVSYSKVHELDRKKLIIFSENRSPVVDDKYNYNEHPNIEMSGIYDKHKCLNLDQIKKEREEQMRAML